MQGRHEKLTTVPSFISLNELCNIGKYDVDDSTHALKGCADQCLKSKIQALTLLVVQTHYGQRPELFICHTHRPGFPETRKCIFGGLWCIGVINKAFTRVCIGFGIFWNFWSLILSATLQNVKYSVLVIGAVVGLSMAFYHIWGVDEFD